MQPRGLALPDASMALESTAGRPGSDDIRPPCRDTCRVERSDHWPAKPSRGRPQLLSSGFRKTSTLAADGSLEAIDRAAIGASTQGHERLPQLDRHHLRLRLSHCLDSFQSMAVQGCTGCNPRRRNGESRRCWGQQQPVVSSDDPAFLDEMMSSLASAPARTCGCAAADLLDQLALD